jgi:hypothetical protein
MDNIDQFVSIFESLEDRISEFEERISDILSFIGNVIYKDKHFQFNFDIVRLNHNSRVVNVLSAIENLKENNNFRKTCIKIEGHFNSNKRLDFKDVYYLVDGQVNSLVLIPVKWISIDYNFETGDHKYYDYKSEFLKYYKDYKDYLKMMEEREKIRALSEMKELMIKINQREEEAEKEAEERRKAKEIRALESRYKQIIKSNVVIDEIEAFQLEQSMNRITTLSIKQKIALDKILTRIMKKFSKTIKPIYDIDENE